MSTKKQKESKYPREELVKNAQAIFGVKPEVLAGALHGTSAKELTKSEVEKAIENFKRKKVK